MLALASILCVALVAFRAWHAGRDAYGFLIWNLVLAWIPFLVALGLYDAIRRRAPVLVRGTLAALWLLFLPNAPYLVTDLVHLGRIHGAPLWYDAGMIGAFAGVGLILGLGSILLVHSAVSRAYGALLGWLLLVPVLGLCSVGVGLGRFARLNSWDALTKPDRLGDVLVSHFSDPLGSRRAVAATVGYAGFLAVAYLVLYVLSSLRSELEQEGRRR